MKMHKSEIYRVTLSVFIGNQIEKIWQYTKILHQLIQTIPIIQF